MALFFLPFSATAQDEIPGYEIYIAEIGDDSAAPVNITDREGYDNQPAFSADGRHLYYTRMEADGQTELWDYDLESAKHTRLTNTAESEYSPTPVPGSQNLSMVRVEADMKQRLWQLDPGDGSLSLLLPEIEPVGYHAWLGADSVALFLLPEPFSLVIAATDGELTTVADNIGRSLHVHPVSKALLYVDQSATPWRIMALDTRSHEHEPLAELFPAQEDFTVSSSGTLWTGLDSKLYKFPAGAGDWQQVADFADHGIAGITRIAVSPDEKQVALVAVE